MGDPAEHQFNPHAPVSNTGASALVPATAPESGAVQPEAAMVETEVLFDVGAASFRGSVPEVVFEPDDRERITATDQFPWRVHASLRITARDGSHWLGTGWFISPRTLVTAGHCVYINGGDPELDGWVRSIEVMPGRNEGVLPFGSVTAATFWSVRGWTERADSRYDYGAILLPAPLGERTGTIGYAAHEDGTLVGTEAHVAGYPGDKPAGTMWHHALPIARVDADRVFYTIDTAGGESGGAVYVVENGLPVAVAVHTYGGGTSNSGTRITPAVFDNLRQWAV